MANIKFKNKQRYLGFGSIWFFICYDENGNSVRIEEHDIREGGGVNTPNGMTHEEFFVERVNDRITDKNDPRAGAKIAQAFLATEIINGRWDFDKQVIVDDTDLSANQNLLKKNLLDNIILNTDSYKVSMWKQYPPGTEYVYSYIESRGGRYDSTLFIGIQSFIKNYLTVPITQEDIDIADKFWTAHGEPFNREGWEYILKEHKGVLPVRVRAVPEGTLVPTKNVLCTIENTDPKVPWLTTWIETAALRAIWYPTTVATNSFEIKKTLREYMEMSGDPAGLAFKLHDFGARGCQSLETASLGAMAHLLNFKGTDTMSGILRAVQDYDADFDKVGFSIPATEHSTITAWGRENEYNGAFDNMIDKFAKPGAIFAVVSDSYDIYKAVIAWCDPKRVDKIKSSGATLVIRPDSGDPCQILPPLFRKVEAAYGAVVNDKGYKVLNNVRFIWGDGINHLSIQTILRMVVDMCGYSADNIAFGMGGALLGAPQRDDQKWAMKASSAKINGVWRDVYKQPITDPGKVSKKGRVTLFKNGEGEYYSGVEDWMQDELRTFYDAGTVSYENWETVVHRASQY